METDENAVGNQDSVFAGCRVSNLIPTVGNFETGTGVRKGRSVS